MTVLPGEPILAIDRRIAGLIAAVPGIGPTVLATLLGELPELGTRCRRIASLAGHMRAKAGHGGEPAHLGLTPQSS